jgi:hypothetical protein
MSHDESKILARELGKLGGFGARWAAGRLPTVSYEDTFALEAIPADVARLVEDVVLPLGRAIEELPSQPEQGKYSLILGGGTGNLNPTIAHVSIARAGSMTKVTLRALAKEGFVKQQTAEGVIRRIETLLMRHDA